MHVFFCPPAEDARESAAEAKSDLKHGAKKANIKAHSKAKESKEESKGWLSRVFRRGKVRVTGEVAGSAVAVCDMTVMLARVFPLPSDSDNLPHAQNAQAEFCCT